MYTDCITNKKILLPRKGIMEIILRCLIHSYRYLLWVMLSTENAKNVCNDAICSNTDGPRDYHTEYNKSKKNII